METGIIMVGPRAGQRTECNSGEHTCLVHKKGSHREMSPKNLDRFNRSVAARNKTSTKATTREHMTTNPTAKPSTVPYRAQANQAASLTWLTSRTSSTRLR